MEDGVSEKGVHGTGKWVGVPKVILVLGLYSIQFQPTFNPAVSPSHIHPSPTLLPLQHH